ncbi:MAG: hypothetical protein HOO06_11615 [Bdellovibrionaceae bacterium]|nr:hypothetical protein [Pseudobdellovibrionaceae bacterium]
MKLLIFIFCLTSPLAFSAEKGQRISSVEMVNFNNSREKESFTLEIKGVPVLTRVGAILPTSTTNPLYHSFTPTETESLGVVNEMSTNPKYGAPIWNGLNMLYDKNYDERKTILAESGYTEIDLSKVKMESFTFPWSKKIKRKLPKKEAHFAPKNSANISFGDGGASVLKTMHSWHASTINFALNEITKIFKQQQEHKSRKVFSENFIEQIESENKILPFERMFFFIYSDLVTKEFMAGFLTIDGSPNRLFLDARIPIEVEFPQIKLKGRSFNQRRVVEIKRFGREAHKSAVSFTEMVATLAQHLQYADLLETTLYAHTDAVGKRLFKTLGFHVEFYPQDLKKSGEYILAISARKFNEIHMQSQVFKTLKSYPFRRPIRIDRKKLSDKDIQYIDAKSLPKRIVEAVEKRQKGDPDFRKKYPGQFHLRDPSGSSHLVYPDTYDMFYLNTINYSSTSSACKNIFSKASIL